MVAKNLLEANLKLGSFSTKVKVKLTIEDEEFAFIEREDTEIEAEITIKYKANDSVKGNNLILIYCKDREKYKLCSSEDVKKKLEDMKEGSGTELSIEACCPYSFELEEKLTNIYKVNNWIKLAEEDFGDLIIEMVKAREVKTETPKKKKIIVDEKEAKDKQPIFEEVEKEKEEISVGPSMKEDAQYPRDVNFLGGELGKLDTKFWLEKLPKKYDYLPDKYILLTIEEGKKVCYGECGGYGLTLSDKIFLLEETIEDLVINLQTHNEEGDFIRKKADDLLNLLSDNSNITKRIKNMLDMWEENKKYFNSLKKVYDDDYMEIYEKSSEEENSFIFTDHMKSYCTNNWCYHYNIKNGDILTSVKNSEKSDYSTSRQEYVRPIVSRLPKVISVSEEVRKRFIEARKNMGNGYHREVDFEKVWMRLLRFH